MAAVEKRLRIEATRRRSEGGFVASVRPSFVAAAAHQAQPSFGRVQQQCFRCGSTDHIIRDCRRPDQRAPRPQQRAPGQRPNGQPFSPCPICNEHGHSPYVCTKRPFFDKPTSKYSKSFQTHATQPTHTETAAPVQPNTRHNLILLDSGATNHFVRDIEILHNPITLPNPVEIRTADNGITVCHTAGDIHLTTPLVKYAPEQFTPQPSPTT